MTYLSDRARECQTSGCDRRAAIILAIDMDGFTDDFTGNPDMGDGMVRIGRHVLSWNSQGFYSLHEGIDISDAESWFDSWRSEYESGEDAS